MDVGSDDTDTVLVAFRRTLGWRRNLRPRPWSWSPSHTRPTTPGPAPSGAAGNRGVLVLFSVWATRYEQRWFVLITQNNHSDHSEGLIRSLWVNHSVVITQNNSEQNRFTKDSAGVESVQSLWSFLLSNQLPVTIHCKRLITNQIVAAIVHVVGRRAPTLNAQQNKSFWQTPQVTGVLVKPGVETSI